MCDDWREVLQTKIYINLKCLNEVEFFAKRSLLFCYLKKKKKKCFTNET